MATTATKINPKANCYKYDPDKFPTEESIVTSFPNGRLGNMISSYLMLSWIQLDHKLATYMEREAIDTLSKVKSPLWGSCSRILWTMRKDSIFFTPRTKRVHTCREL